jgi:hypothetical protein
MRAAIILIPLAVAMLTPIAIDALSEPELELQILPTPTADRTFQFVKPGKSFMGTPLEVESLTPHALLVIGRKEASGMAVQAATMAFMVGQWTQEPGTSLEMVKIRQNLGPVWLDTDLTEDQIARHNLVLLGKNNELYPQLAARLQGEGSFIEVVENALAPDRDLMFVSDARAAFYLANKRLYFKSGAYKSFYSFAKMRALIESENFAAALHSLDDPEAIRGCGKPVILAIGHKENIPPEMMKVAAERNKLVFQDLRQSLEAGAKEAAIATWQAAMEKCYACHQGQDGVQRWRMFVPNQAEHEHHSTVAAQFDLDCDTCHKGKTTRIGYR